MDTPEVPLQGSTWLEKLTVTGLAAVLLVLLLAGAPICLLLCGYTVPALVIICVDVVTWVVIALDAARTRREKGRTDGPS